MNRKTNKRKHTVIPALIVSVLLFLPAMSFAGGAIIGYAAGWRPAPTDAQLDRLTHVMVFQLYPSTSGNGSLYKGELPSWSLSNFINRAHAKGVQVSISVGGWDNRGAYTAAFVPATESANRATFVNNLKDFVNQYDFDGVDIDWEFPSGATQWNQCMVFLKDLKDALPGKRISIAVSGSTPNANRFPGNVRSQIWNAVDAIHLMSYDMGGAWPTHSDATRSKQLIDAWAVWGNGQPGFDKEKLILGCAFFSASPGPSLEYKNGAAPPHCDGPESLKDKVDHCYDNGYGGVMIWELSQDKNISTVPDLLSAIWEATQAKISVSSVELVPVQTSLQVFPNPVTTELYITLFPQEKADYTIYNNTGQIVLQGILQDNATVNVQSLLNGNYYLRISGKTMKIIKVRGINNL